MYVEEYVGVVEVYVWARAFLVAYFIHYGVFCFLCEELRVGKKRRERNMVYHYRLVGRDDVVPRVFVYIAIQLFVVFGVSIRQKF